MGSILTTRFFILSRLIMVRIFHKTQKMFFFKNEELFSRTVRSFFQNQKYPTNSRSFIFSYFNFFVREGSISRIRRFCFISKTSRGVSSFLGVSRFFSRKAFVFGLFRFHENPFFYKRSVSLFKGRIRSDSN